MVVGAGGLGGRKSRERGRGPEVVERYVSDGGEVCHGADVRGDPEGRDRGRAGGESYGCSNRQQRCSQTYPPWGTVRGGGERPYTLHTRGIHVLLGVRQVKLKFCRNSKQ